MRQFNKLVAIEPVSLTEWGEDEINRWQWAIPNKECDYNTLIE